jgi:periplasmic protein TonB
LENAANDNRTPPARQERDGLIARKRVYRRRGRARAVTLTAMPLTEAQRRHDPLPPARGGRSRLGRSAWFVALVVGSVAVHVGIVVLGFVIGGRDRGKRENVRQEIKIEIAEKKVEPPPPPVEKPPEPERRMRTPPKVVEAEKPPEPKAPPSKAPPRVVGLSLESTAEGGGGPSFAVGNTREGKTADKARAPEEIPTQAPPPADEESKTNRAAARIPVAGVKYEQPKRRAPIKPPYPETLKSQGIEADVTVMLQLDETGKVKSVKIIRESTYPEFNELARKIAMTEQFDPATRDGVPIPFSISFTYRWRLEDE